MARRSLALQPGYGEARRIASWNMRNGALLQSDSFGTVATAWQIAGTGEFDLV